MRGKRDCRTFLRSLLVCGGLLANDVRNKFQQRLRVSFDVVFGTINLLFPRSSTQ